MKGCVKGDDMDISHTIRRPFEIYVPCNQLHTGLGNAFVDTGSQVSLVKESGLIRGSNIGHHISHIQGITGNFTQLKGQTKLNIRDTLSHDILWINYP
jgi:hypothetical protein